MGNRLGRRLAVIAVAVAGCSSDPAPEADAGATGSVDGATSVAPREQFWVVNTEGESISVIDDDRQEVIDTIDLGAQPHGQAPAAGGDRVYITTDSGDGEVIAIDTATRDEAWRSEVGDRLNQPHLTGDGRFLYVPDLLGRRTFVVDVAAGAVVDEIAMYDGLIPLLALHNTYASHDGARMYVTAILSNRIAEIDVASRSLARVIEVDGQPRPAAITADDRTLYLQLSDLHGFVAIDLAAGDEIARIEWPDDGSRPPGYDDQSLPTKCHGIGLAPGETELWAASNLDGMVRAYSVPALDLVAEVPVGTLPNWIAFSRDGRFAYVTNTDLAADHGTVSIIDTASRQVVRTVDVGRAPKRIHRVDVPR